MEEGRERAGGRVAGSLASPATRARYAPRGEAPGRRTWTRTRSSTTVSATRASSMSGTPFLTARARQSSCLPATRSCTAPCTKTPTNTTSRCASWQEVPPPWRGKGARLPCPRARWCSGTAASLTQAGEGDSAWRSQRVSSRRSGAPEAHARKVECVLLGLNTHSAGEGWLHVSHGSRPSLPQCRASISRDATSGSGRGCLLSPSGTRVADAWHAQESGVLWRLRTTSSTPSSSEQPARVGASRRDNSTSAIWSANFEGPKTCAHGRGRSGGMWDGVPGTGSSRQHTLVDLSSLSDTLTFSAHTLTLCLSTAVWVE